MITRITVKLLPLTSLNLQLNDRSFNHLINQSINQSQPYK